MSDNLPAVKEDNSPTNAPIRRKPRTSDFKLQILTHYANGMRPVDIGRLFGVSSPAVKSVLKRNRGLLQSIRLASVPEEVRQNAIRGAEIKAVESLLSPDKHKAANIRDVAFAFKTLHQARRLESNQSTANVEIVVKQLDPSKHRK